jgi:glycosyltransferase involved in cell wall biosynthesis
MRTVLVSKALVVGAYQRKAEEIARLGVDLTVLTPPAWRDRRGTQIAERTHTAGYELRTIPLRFNGSYHLHHYPTLYRELQRLQPDVVHLDEEPYNAATWLGVRAARRAGAATTFFTWQNLQRSYPPPFRWFEQAIYAACPQAIAGNQDAAHVLRRKGYGGEITVLPQFGVDPSIFSPPDQPAASESLRIGYAGGLLPEKGIDLLLRSCADLRGQWQLSIAGGGAEEMVLRRMAEELGIADRVQWVNRIPSDQMPTFYRGLDVLALPSRTLPNWKEQFGRVLIEAMSCGVAVIGSDSGEIPHVISAAGLIFPEEDAARLAAHLQRLLDDRSATRQLGQAGRARVLAHFTMAHIAAETVAVYRRLVRVKE